MYVNCVLVFFNFIFSKKIPLNCMLGLFAIKKTGAYCSNATDVLMS